MALLSRPMRQKDVVTLANRLGRNAIKECLLQGVSPEEALRNGVSEGPTRLVVDEWHLPVGAYGWTHTGYIWSLWGDLTHSQSRIVLKAAPSVIMEAAALHSPRRLQNWVDVDNRSIRHWLEKTKCFDFAETLTSPSCGRQMLKFYTKSIEELANV